jgi:putative ABC transport system ATP-binding protein
MSLFEVQNLTLPPWIDAFTCALDAGQVLFVMGPSGSGKTQLLRALADLIPAECSSLTVAGQERDAISPQAWRSQVLYLHQHPPIFEGDVRQNIQRVTELHCWQTRAPADVAIPGLAPDQDASHLSGGEGQLLALYRALALDPKVLLLDEATAAMDPATRRAAEDALKAWLARGRAALWVTHDEHIAGRFNASVHMFADARPAGLH